MSDYDAGPWFICQRSGFKVRLKDTVVEWTGLRVARRYADIRNPQDFVRAVPDNPFVKGAMPEPADVYLSSPVTVNDL